MTPPADHKPPPRRLAILAAFLLVLGVAGAASAQGPRPSEYEVKAAFLYNFARFVQWPAGQPQPADFTICILGDDPFAGACESIEGRQVRGRRLVVERRGELGDGPCQILFISASERRRLAPILKALEGRPVLTVSEVHGFARRGGMINFVLEQNRVRFEINAEAVERAGLEMSAKLLRVARVVRD